MALSNTVKAIAAVVCTLLIQYATCVPIHKQSKSINKRSAGTVEFTMDSDSHATFSSQMNPLADAARVSQESFNMDLTCPVTVSTGVSDPIYKRSSCPWYYVDDHDPKRFPATILKAESLCSYAIDSNNKLECSPITQSITVLRQQPTKDSAGNYIWLEDTQTIVIGYTAAGRKLVETHPTTAAPSNLPTPDFA